eukprot:5594844-Amphidinium_carterae.1
MARIPWSPLSGSAPSKLLLLIEKTVTAVIVRIQSSGTAPLKPFVFILNSLTARITWSPLPGSAPSKLFM